MEVENQDVGARLAGARPGAAATFEVAACATETPNGRGADRQTGHARQVAVKRQQLMAQAGGLCVGRDRTAVRFGANGFTAAESDADVVLIGVADDRHPVRRGLSCRGALLREVGSDGCLRVSIGPPAEMAAFTDPLIGVTS